MAKLLNNIQDHKSQLKALLKAQQNNHLAHGLLFVGPSGIGREKAAWALSQTLLCESDFPACGQCDSCLSVETKQNQNILFIAPQGLFIKVESIRQITQFLSLKSSALGRIIIIYSAHSMNLQAANSLLKILEEPPKKVYFILISSYLSALPITIRSRVQTVRFLQLKDNRINHLNQNEPLKQQAFLLLKQAVLGEQLCSLEELSNLVKKRESALFVCQCWQQILRDAYMLLLNSEDRVIHQDQKDILDVLKKIPVCRLEYFFQETIELEQNLKENADSVLIFDNLFIKIQKIINDI